MQLTTAYATSHMLFASVIWGHALGFKWSLHDDTAGGSAGKLGVIYRNALRWSISTPTHTCGAALYLIAHAIPLQVGGYTACGIPLVWSVNGNGNGIPLNGIPFNGITF